MPFADDLLKWYDESHRSLPWRGEADPYRVWLSEIMLQQTQAETVKGYYARFLARFPDVFHLAAAEEAEVLKLWEGLGYYSRARNLLVAARMVALNGTFPRDAAGLRALPGVGPYVASAVASIAYGEPAPALDGNQARVLSRVLAWQRELKTPFDLLAPARELIDRQRPGDYNQALMDLGARVCLPRQPACNACPVSRHCRAREDGNPLDYPKKPPPAAKKQQDRTILLVRAGDGLLVRRRPKGLLGGLYEFVNLEGRHDPEALRPLLEAQGFRGASIVRRLPDARHVFTHLIWHMQGWEAACESAPPGYICADAEALSALPFPTALRVYRAIADGMLESSP